MHSHTVCIVHIHFYGVQQLVYSLLILVMFSYTVDNRNASSVIINVTQKEISNDYLQRTNTVKSEQQFLPLETLAKLLFCHLQTEVHQHIGIGTSKW